VSATLPGDRPVDIELLADFSEGLLAPAEAEAVRAQVDADPDWAAALSLLRESAPGVTAALAAYAADTSAAMPPDVADRLTAALIAERSAGDTAVSEQVTPTQAAPRRRPLRSPATRPPTSRKSSGRGRRSRSPWTLGALAAVVVLVVVGLGFVVKFVAAPTEKSSGSASVASAPELDGVGLPGLTITSSGIDYTSLTFSAVTPTKPSPLAPSAATAIKSPAGINGPSLNGPKALRNVPPALDRLLDPVTLRACAIKIEGLATGTARSIDFATYHGAPAIIVTLESPTSRVAADPNCDLISPVTSAHS